MPYHDISALRRSLPAIMPERDMDQHVPIRKNFNEDRNRIRAAVHTVTIASNQPLVCIGNSESSGMFPRGCRSAISHVLLAPVHVHTCGVFDEL